MYQMPKVVVLTGAGISAESGLPTFRDDEGLWSDANLEQYATQEAWQNDPKGVLHFHNEFRKQVRAAQPNAAHFALANLEHELDTVILTQNVDNLHERAGSKHVIHMHGNIFEARSNEEPSVIYPVKENILLGDSCNNGHQLRPNVVWFDEMVFFYEEAVEYVTKADYLIVVGTSLKVYPAAGLILSAQAYANKYLIDPNYVKPPKVRNLDLIYNNATLGVPEAIDKIQAHHRDTKNKS